MKRCPRCGQIYTDDLMFCLSDGTPLAVRRETEEPTVVRQPRVNVHGVSPLFKYLSFALLFLLVLVVVGVAGVVIVKFLIYPGEPPTNEADTVVKPPTPKTSPAVTNSPVKTVPTPDEREELEREREKLERERRKLEEDKRREAEKEIAPPTFTDPGTTRITFRRGAVSETVSGTVGRSRGFVLRTLAGQYLSATINSTGGCVVFGSGSTSTGYTTSQGDSSLNIRNTCGSPSRFSLTVTVR